MKALNGVREPYATMTRMQLVNELDRYAKNYNVLDKKCDAMKRQIAVLEKRLGDSDDDTLCEGGCGTPESASSLVGERHGLKLCENCIWEHDHGEEDCGWQCDEIPAALRKTHRKGKCGTHCPNPKTWALPDKSAAEETKR